MLSVTWFSCSNINAQTEDPPAETEIICFAAQKQWVCAPADQKQQAHDKAMKLVKENSDSLQTDQVEIKLLDMNQNLGQQVREEPVNLTPEEVAYQESIKDFIPRETKTVIEAQSDDRLIGQEPVNITNDNSDGIAEPELEQDAPVEVAPVIQRSASQQQPINADLAVTTSKHDFNYWQRNYGDSWSFQVIGTSNRHHLDQFIKAQGLQNTEYAVVKTQSNGADWWVVLSGLYDSRELALSQRHQLPSQLAGQAWVRQVKTIVGEAE